MVVAAVINAQTLQVPNRLSLVALVVGWLTAFSVSLTSAVPSQGGGIAASLAATLVAFLLLVPVYASGWIGAGCVKMQMAFGSWIGCALAIAPAAWLAVLATVFGGMLTTIAVLIALKQSTTFRQAHGIRLFPAQITLSVGSIVGVIAAFALGWV
jgi:Flp pilus assembly protein protease CpaA